MPGISGQGADSADIWRFLEVYTPTLHAVDTNANNDVVVANITGRGILASIGWQNENVEDVFVEITKDGIIIRTYAKVTDDSLQGHGSLTMMMGFETDCLVRMKLLGAGGTLGRYTAVTLVE